MALEMKATSQWWYGRFLVNGKLRRFPLTEKRGGVSRRIRIEGRRSPSLAHPEQGSPEFVRSYHRALAAHDLLKENELSGKAVEDQAQRIIEARTGTRFDFMKLEAVPEAWASLPRKRAPVPLYLDTGKKKLGRFVEYIRRHAPGVEDLAAVRAEHVRAFLDDEAARGFSPRTWNIMLKLLKTVFRRMEPNADAYRSFLRNAPERDEETVHRQPFNEEEIVAIIEAAKKDEVLRGPVVTAICTAMRRGDCCLLKRESVDLDAGFIRVRTSKTGETAEIPILSELRAELDGAAKDEGEYVFPAAAELYRMDPHAVDRRLRAILAAAGFVDADKAAKMDENARPALPEVPPDELQRRALAAIDARPLMEDKRERMKAALTAYVSGKSLPAIAREMGASKSTVSLYLNEVETMTGLAVFRRRPKPAAVRGTIRTGGNGQRRKRASVRGWHSFRVAFVTRALSRGMSEELVRRVTGHTAVDVVRKHYFKPGREEFRREFEKVMPRMLMNGAKTRDERMRAIVGGMTGRTWKRDAARLLAILDGKD